jgi:hypothetical protein
MNRRNVIGGMAAAALAVIGGAAWKFHIFAKRYPATPYDDLLGQLVEREPAAKLGAAVLHSNPGFRLAPLAADLRQPGRELARRAPLDAGQNRLLEADGWVLPDSVARYAALAASI